MDMQTNSPATGQLVTIGQAAKLIDVSIKTLRRWDKSGQLSTRRNRLNQRLYDPLELLRYKSQPLSFQTKIDALSGRYFSISQVAQHLKVSVKTVRRWEKTGKIESERNPRNQRIFSYPAMEAARKRSEAERILPAVAKSYTSFWQTWPQNRRFVYALPLPIIIISFGIFGLMILNDNNNIDVYTQAISSPLALQAGPATPTDPLQLADTGTGIHANTPYPHIASIQLNNPAIESPTITASASAVGQIDANLINIASPSAAAQTLLYNLFLEFLAQRRASITTRDIDLASTTRLTTNLSINDTAKNDNLSVSPTPASLNLLNPVNLDQFGNLAEPTPTPTPTKTPENNPLQSISPTLSPLTGHDQISAGQSALTIESPNLKPESVVAVTFEADYSPATKYWVTKDIGEHPTLTIHLDLAPNQDTPFSWIIYP